MSTGLTPNGRSCLEQGPGQSEWNDGSTSPLARQLALGITRAIFVTEARSSGGGTWKSYLMSSS